MMTRIYLFDGVLLMKKIDRSGQNNGRYSTGLAMSSDSRRGIYNIWQNMKQRCLNSNHHKYSRYGGRGIKICEEWMSISGFKAWADTANYKPGYSIDRIDNDGDYCPENCRFVSVSENSRKKRTTKITAEQASVIRTRTRGRESDVAIASDFGVSPSTVWSIKNGITHVPDGECTRMLKERNKHNGNDNTNG